MSTRIIKSKYLISELHTNSSIPTFQKTDITRLLKNIFPGDGKLPVAAAAVKAVRWCWSIASAEAEACSNSCRVDTLEAKAAATKGDMLQAFLGKSMSTWA